MRAQSSASLRPYRCPNVAGIAHLVQQDRGCDERANCHRDADGVQTAQLDEFGRLDAGGRCRRCPQTVKKVVELPPAVTRELAGGASERGRLQERQCCHERGHAQHTQGGADRAILADQRCGRDQQLGDVGGMALPVARRSRVVEADDPGTLPGDQDVGGVEETVRNARAVHAADILPNLAEELVGHLLRGELRESDRTDRSLHEQRRAGTRDARGKHRRHMCTGLARGQHQVGLVLHLLETAEHELRARVAIEEDAPHLGEEPRIGLVASDHLDAQRAVGVVGEHHRRSGALMVREPHLASVDPELRQRGRDLLCRGSTARRPEQQVHGGGHRPPQHDRGEQVVRIRVPEIHRGDGETDHKDAAEDAGRARDIRACRADHRDDHCDAHRRERRRPAKAGRDAHAMTKRLVRDHDLPEGPGRDPGHDSRGQEVASQAPTPPDQRGHRHEPDRPQRAEPIQRGENGEELRWQRVHEIEDRTFACRDITGVIGSDDQDDDPAGESKPVARPALKVSLASPTEQSVAPSCRGDGSDRDRLIRKCHRSHERSLPR